jgi:hypothetical protein
VADGLVIEHWANRDDQGMAEQLGWVSTDTGLPAADGHGEAARPK